LNEAARRGYVPDATVCATDVPAGRPEPWMCLRNAEKLGVYPMEACVKIGDTIPDIEEGLNAGMWTIGLAKSGNELGMNEKEIAALPADRLQARLERAYQRMAAAGAHCVVDTIADVLPAIDQIQERITAGERP
jgi:phosphonoacetaldehyde hydrolase